MTQNTLHQFHRRALSQLENGRLFTAFFNLTELDILKLNLNDRIYLESEKSWFNINRIIDYNANGSQLTKVELVTIDDGQDINVSKNIGIGIIDGVGVINPIKWNPISAILNDGLIGVKKTYERVNNINIGNTGVIIGKGNFVAAGVNASINGNNNISNTPGVIIGNNNIVDSMQGESMIFGNNITAIKPNTFYANNIAVNKSVDFQDAEVNNLNIGPINFNKSGLTFSDNYVNSEYVDPNYFSGSSTSFFFDGETIVVSGAIDFTDATITGAQGMSGSSGSSGTSGTSGANGSSGTSGTSGTSGINGASGSSGTSGSSGVNGANGSSGTSGTGGTSGTSGVNGANGSSGSSGVNGSSGTSGVNGANGSSGTSGTHGTSGVNGANGSSGVNGANGSSGTSGVNGGEWVIWNIRSKRGPRYSWSSW